MTNTRNIDANYINQGACNPTAIANTIAKHTTAMTRDGKDTPTITKDPAIRLMVNQLAYICKLEPNWSFDDYLVAVEKVEERAEREKIENRGKKKE